MTYRILFGAFALVVATPALAAETAPAQDKPKCECCAKMAAESKKADCCDEKSGAKAAPINHDNAGHTGH